MTREASLYLFDPEDRQWRRPWETMLPAGFHEVSIEAARFVHTDGEARDGIVVVHASHLPDERVTARLVDAALRSNLRLVLISGSHQPGPSNDDGVYRRRCPVRVRETDEEFRSCFTRFWNHLHQTEEICFELLEPPRGMLQVLAVLCQGYLLAHVEGDDFRVHLPDTEARVTEVATEAMERLGIGRALASPALSAALAVTLGRVNMTSTVREKQWWNPLDTDELRKELAVAGLDDPCLEAFVQELEADDVIPPSSVVGAYCALEGHLRSTLGLDRKI